MSAAACLAEECVIPSTSQCEEGWENELNRIRRWCEKMNVRGSDVTAFELKKLGWWLGSWNVGSFVIVDMVKTLLTRRRPTRFLGRRPLCGAHLS
jgi:hypothetical protein